MAVSCLWLSDTIHSMGHRTSPLVVPSNSTPLACWDRPAPAGKVEWMAATPTPCKDFAGPALSCHLSVCPSVSLSLILFSFIPVFLFSSPTTLPALLPSRPAVGQTAGGPACQ